MGRPKLMLYSLVIQQPDPLFKLHHPAITLHTRNARSFSDPSNHTARAVRAQDALARTPLWSTMMKVFPSGNGYWDPKQANGNDSGHDYLANEGWRWQEDIQAWAYCHHVLSPMGFKRQKQNPPNPPQQDSPVPCMPREQTPQQPTPGPSGTQWLEDLSRKPSQHDEPIPGLSPSSKPPEDVPTCEPEPEVAPTQSTEEPFACPATPRSVIIIDYTPFGSHSPFSFPLCDPENPSAKLPSFGQ
ncbi:hypothetical protein O181_057292 [Austropuccinia psidii MF-1]|uniref:Uncharacterized protein n=1 Tax=Austropuccinia psidii MF-1 TaxID=1389203 RepID=A0A9Q3EHJ3_9BASI|nr:hypothetical protein [Austropuccinia psidii MF-1]